MPIIVGVPEVYESGHNGDVQGGKAEDSAKQALRQIELRFGSTILDYIVGKFIFTDNCTVYQAKCDSV